MIIILKRNNVILIGLLLVLSIALIGINAGGVFSSKPASGQNAGYVGSGGVIGTGIATDGGTSAAGKNGAVRKTVILDPGHGGEDPGAVSDYSGSREKDINLSIALKVKKLLESLGCSVMMTRSDDRLVYEPGTTNVVRKRMQDLERRKNMMDNSGADIVVSIHLNKFPKTQYLGAQTFYPPVPSTSRQLAESIQSSLVKIADPVNKRVALLKSESIIILKNAKTTTAVVECGFLSNPDDEKRLRTDEYQNKIAEAINDGIVNYFKTH